MHTSAFISNYRNNYHFKMNSLHLKHFYMMVPFNIFSPLQRKSQGTPVVNEDNF